MTCPSSCKEPDCTLTYAAHLHSIGFTADAMPTRKPEAAATNRRESRWQRDHAAFRRLVKDGYQPKTVDGSRYREQYAENRFDIESRPVDIDYNDGKGRYGKQSII